MKKYITILFALCYVTVRAQTADTIMLTLQQAKDLGLKRRFDIQANQYDVSVAENNVVKARNEWLPEINATGNIRYNSQLQTTLIPAGFLGSTKPQLYALGSKNTSVFGLELNQPVVQPGLRADTKIAQNNVAMQKERNKAYEIDIKTQITQAYMNVQLKELQLKIIADDESRYKDYYAVAEATFKAGSLLENDLLKAKLDYENAKTETEKERQQYSLALENLEYQLNVPATTQLVLADSLTVTNEPAVNTDQIERTELKQLRLQQEDIRLQVNKIHQSNLPEVSFFANYSKQFLNENFDYSNGQMWSPFSYSGLKLSVPITRIYKSKTNIHEYKLKEEQTALLLQQKTNDIHYEVQNANTGLSNALQNMQTAESNYALSQTIHNTQKQQYKLGALLYRDLLDTEKSLSTTEQNYIKSIYDYLVAKMNYLKANGAL